MVERNARQLTDESLRKPGTFKPGFDARRDASQIPPRRKAGTPNAITRDIKRGIVDAAEKYGSDGKGKDGLTGYLFHLAGKHPKAFAGLLGKILPLQVSGSVGQYIGTVNVVAVPEGRFLSPQDVARLAAQSEPATLDNESATVPELEPTTELDPE
jgi:hypothetical protein